jgi:hypothetical protein
VAVATHQLKRTKMIYALISYQLYRNWQGPVSYTARPIAILGNFMQAMQDLAKALSEDFDTKILPSDIQVVSFTILTKEQYDQLVGGSE